MRSAINIIKATLPLLFAVMATGCLKKIDVFNSNHIEVVFNNSGAKYLTSDVTVNPKDSLYFDYMITSQADMKYVYLLKNGTELLRDTLTVATRNKYSSLKKLMADSIPGVYTYNVTAKDTGGVYMGTSATITVTVAPDIYYYTNRRLYVPDTTGKVAKAYFSAATGEIFSYTEGAANSARIDFGFFYDTTSTGTPPKQTIYALNASGFAPYDISTWTKNATVFKRVTSPVTFATLNSSAELQKQGVANLSSGALSKISCATGVTTAGVFTGNTYVFKTAAGKYGALTILYTSADSPLSGNYVMIDVRIQR
jgi:hypothetical protein